jgi:hypothetical protein
MKLYRFPYSPYVLKVQLLLDLMAGSTSRSTSPYGRSQPSWPPSPAGYIYVPCCRRRRQGVFDSRRICQHLLAGGRRQPSCRRPLDGPHLGPTTTGATAPSRTSSSASARPGIRDSWQTAGERALYVLIKERKFGPGCVDAWERDADGLFAQGNELLAPPPAPCPRSPSCSERTPRWPTAPSTACSPSCGGARTNARAASRRRSQRWMRRLEVAGRPRAGLDRDRAQALAGTTSARSAGPGLLTTTTQRRFNHAARAAAREAVQVDRAAHPRAPGRRTSAARRSSGPAGGRVGQSTRSGATHSGWIAELAAEDLAHGRGRCRRGAAAGAALDAASQR